MGTLTIHSRKLFTLNPDGTELKELIYPTDWDQNRIGEYKKIEISCSSTQPLADTIIYFSPALFISPILTAYDTGGIPAEGYAYVVDSAATMGTFTMGQFNIGGAPAALLKNWEVEIEIGYGNDFVIKMKYYQFIDRDKYFNSSSQYNQEKLLKDKIGNGELNVAGVSVYTHPEQVPRFYICQFDPVTTNKSFTLSVYRQYKAGFYSKNSHETSPYFTNEAWTLEDSEGSRTTFNTLEDTKVNFQVDSATAPSDWFAWLIRTDKTDNGVDFKSNYEASFAKIYDLVGTTIYDNKLKGPGLKLALDSGTTYKGYFHVDKDGLTPGATYRFISVAYDLEGGFVNSFISDEIIAAVPSFNGNQYDLGAKFKDYFNEWTGNQLTCIPEERVQTIINVGYPYMGFTTDIENRLGLTVPNDIRRYLTQVKVEIYQDASVQLRHYYDRKTAYKVDAITYTVPENMELNFTDSNLEIKYLWRNRYESDIPNIETTYNGVPISVGSDQNWCGRTLKVKTTLSLYYDDYVAPFTDEIVFVQEVTVKNYNTSTLHVYVEKGQSAPSATEYYCDTDDICLDGHFATATPSDYRLMNTIERNTGTIATIEESEPISGVLTQNTTPKIISQDTSYGDSGANRATFCIEGTELVYNVFYKVCAIAKKFLK